MSNSNTARHARIRNPGHYIGKTSQKWRMTPDEKRMFRRDLADMVSDGRLPPTREILHAIAGAEDVPAKGAPMGKASIAFWRRNVRAATNQSFSSCILAARGSSTPITARRRSLARTRIRRTRATMRDPVRSTAERLKDAVVNVTKEWAKQRKAEERHASALANRRSQILARAAFVGLGATPRKSQSQRLRAVKGHKTRSRRKTNCRIGPRR
jgi:hypothetical protein